MFVANNIENNKLQEPSSESDKPVGVEGWLLWFCLNLAVINPIITIFMVLYNYLWYLSNPKIWSKLSWDVHVLALSETVPLVWLALAGLYVGIRLWQEKSNAVRLAKGFLISFLILNLCSVSLVLIVQGVFVRSWGSIRIETWEWAFMRTIQTLIYFGVWFAYLHSSRRVQNTFPEACKR